MAQIPNTGQQPGESLPSPLQQRSHPEQSVHLLGPQHPGTRAEQFRHAPKTNTVDFHSLWIWEILSFAAAGVLYGIFFYLLFRYDGQLVSRWEQDSPISGLFRTLQSAISFITTIMKAAILLPVASALGQLKWHKAHHASRVKDMELIDGASRGNLGAVRLLFSRSALHSTSLGCIIIISAILLAPFIQNTVQIQTRIFFDETQPNTAAPLLPVTNKIVTRGSNQPSANDTGIGLAMFSSIQAAWAAAAKSVDIQTTELPYKCPFDFCEWTNFTTLGVLHDCREADVNMRRHPTTDVLYAASDEADIDNLTNVTRRSDGQVAINEWLTRLHLRARDSIPERSGYANVSKNAALLTHFAALGYVGNGTYQATECVLYWTALRYKSFSLNTSAVEWTARYNEYWRTSSNISRATQEPIVFDELKTCTFNNTVVEPCNFSVDPSSYRGVTTLLIPFLSDTSEAYPREMPTDPSILDALDFTRPQIEMFYGDWKDRIKHGDIQLQGSLRNQSDRFMKQMSQYISNNIRSNSGLFVSGRGASFDAYFAINKRYAAYPTVIFAAAIVFVSVTAWRTRKERIWKNSALALLFHGLDHGTDAGVQGTSGEDLGTIEGMERASAKITVWLRPSASSDHLKLRTE